MTNGRHLNDPETYAIIGAAMAVHTEFGCGFLEAVYKSALAIELRRRGIPFDREVALPIHYRGEPLPLPYRVDFICDDAVMVEVKAQDALTTTDLAHALNHLRAARIERGLLLNFGATSLEHRRVVWGYSRSGGEPGMPPPSRIDASAAPPSRPTVARSEQRNDARLPGHVPRSVLRTPWRARRPGGAS